MNHTFPLIDSPNYFNYFPKIELGQDKKDILFETIFEIEKNNLWNNIRKISRTEDFDFEFNKLDGINDTDKNKRRDYLKRVVYAVNISNMIEDLGLKCKTAYLFKTLPYEKVYIHRENRTHAINFPLAYEPGRSYVGFYRDDLTEITKCDLYDDTPVYFNVSNWHTVINNSHLPRIVLTCSDLDDDWLNLIKSFEYF